MAKTRIRVTKPSLPWAFLMLFGASRHGNGCTGCLLTPLLILPRLFFAYLYVNNEGYWIDKKRGIMIGKNFREPSSVGDFLKSFFQSKWLDTKEIALSRIFESGNYDQDPGPGVFSWHAWIQLTAIGTGPAPLPTITTTTTMKALRRRVEKAYNEWKRNKDANDRQKKIDDAARDELDKEARMEELRAERARQNLE
jgi:hypothetical protein